MGAATRRGGPEIARGGGGPESCFVDVGGGARGGLARVEGMRDGEEADGCGRGAAHRHTF